MYVWMSSVKDTCTANFFANERVTWCSAFGIPAIWVRYCSQHSKNRYFGPLREPFLWNKDSRCE